MTELDFEAALAAKLAAPEEGTTATEEVTDEQQLDVQAEVAEQLDAIVGEDTESERPRDEQGRFSSLDQVTKTYVAQFGMTESEFLDLSQSARTAVKSAAHQSDVIGRQGVELGELRKIAEQIASSTPAQNSISQLGNALEENPQAVAYWAAQEGNEQVLDQAIAAWTQKALDENDATALRDAQRFDREIDLARMKYEFSQEVSPSIEKVKQEAGQRATQIARRDLAQTYPDFEKVLEAVQAEPELLRGLSPDMLQPLQENDPKAAFDLVYRYGKVALLNQAAASTEASKAESLAAKRAATVATSTSTPVSGEKSKVDLFKEEILKPDAHSVHYGLTE